MSDKNPDFPNLNVGGNDGNRNGGGRKPESKLLEKELRALLEETGPGRKKKARILAEKLFTLACRGNGVALRQVLDRIDGPVTIRIEAEIDDVSMLTDEERAARALALLERARARRDGSAASDAESERPEP